MTALEQRFLQLLGWAGAVILLHQILDLVSVTQGVGLTASGGRVRLVTMVWSRVPALLAADTCLILAAVLTPSGRALRLLGSFHLLLALTAAVGVPLFLTDAGRLAGGIPGPGLPAFRCIVARLLVGLSAISAVAVVTGRSLRRLARAD